MVSFQQLLDKEKRRKSIPRKNESSKKNVNRVENRKRKITNALVEEPVIKKKKSQHAPREFTTKKPTYEVGRDPVLNKKRYKAPKKNTNLSFETKKGFDQKYDFLGGMLEEELDTLYKQYSVVRGQEKLEIKKQIDQKETKLKAIQKSRVKREIENEFYEKQAQVIKQTGKNPYFLGEKKLEQLVKKKTFEKLKEAGKLQKYLVKKRKRNKQKDLKRMLNVAKS